MTLKWIGFELLILGAVLCLPGIETRFRVEQDNRRVEIAIDISEARKVAASEGVDLFDVLVNLRDAGATSILLPEDTLESLRDTGILEVVPSSKHNSTLALLHQGSYSRVRENLEHRTNVKMEVPEQFTGVGLEDAGIVLYERWDAVKDFGVGFDPEVLGLANKAGLRVVARVVNNINPNSERIEWTLNSLRKNEISTVIFTGQAVLGWSSLVSTTAEHFKTGNRLNFGSIEFGKQSGDERLVRLAPGNTIRVHTITPAEMVTSTPSANVQRFTLAARERNIRMLIVRLFMDSAQPLRSANTYISTLRAGLYRSGLSVGEATAYRSTPHGLTLLSRIGAAFVISGGVLLVCECLFGLSTVLVGRVIGVVIFIGIFGMSAFGQGTLIKIVALTGACALPSLAVMCLLSNNPLGIQHTFLRACFVFMCTLFGPLAIVALLSDTVFIVKGSTFLGVKLTLVAPLVFAIAFHVFGLRGASPTDFVTTVRRKLNRVKDLLQQPLLLWQVCVSGIVLVSLGIMLMRSGNESSVGVSSLELSIRSILDRVLFVRPRFKDLLFQPFVALCVMMPTYKPYLHRTSAVLASIALGSIVNTFCHLHTPLLISSLRVAYGVVFGVVIAVIVLQLLKRVRPLATSIE